MATADLSSGKDDTAPPNFQQMFNIIPNGSDRLEVVLSGKLAVEDMKIALDELVSKSQNIEKGKMLWK